MGVRFVWTEFIPLHAVDPINTVKVIGGDDEVIAALSLLSIYAKVDTPQEDWVELLDDHHFDLMLEPEYRESYNKRISDIDAFIKVNIRLSTRNIPGVKDPIILAKAPRTRFKPNTIIL